MYRLPIYKFAWIVFFGGLLFCSCQKKGVEVKCYECEMTYASGIQAAMQYPCSADIAQWQKEQKDNNGDGITSVCREK